MLPITIQSALKSIATNYSIAMFYTEVSQTSSNLAQLFFEQLQVNGMYFI